jgi:hypothetical protein
MFITAFCNIIVAIRVDKPPHIHALPKVDRLMPMEQRHDLLVN